MNLVPLQHLPGARFILRASLTVALAAAGLMLGGCASQPSARNVDLFVRTVPLPTLVPGSQVLATAQRVAATREGDFALQGVGASMEPVYVSGTAVVVHPTAFHMLRRGMPVVYMNRRGASVAHMLLEKVEGGWLAIGLNNADPDDALVTPENLVGIIKHAYAAEETAYRMDVASAIALHQAVEKGAPIALLH
jgi:hypothetical protein